MFFSVTFRLISKSNLKNVGLLAKENFPAAQQPKMRPFRCCGAPVTFTSIHPIVEPMINVRRMLIGINHLLSVETKARSGNRMRNKFSPSMNVNCQVFIIEYGNETHKRRTLSKVTVFARLLPTSAGLNTRYTN